MATVYKLTDADGYTRRGESNACKWGRGVTHTAKGTGGLCTDGCIHAYTSPELAVLFNPLHARITDPILFIGEMEITHRDASGMKVGGKSLTTLEQVPIPEVSVRQKKIFAILCADAALRLSIQDMPPKALENLAKWRQWRDDYMSDRKSAILAGSAVIYAFSASHEVKGSDPHYIARVHSIRAAGEAARAASVNFDGGFIASAASFAASLAANAANLYNSPLDLAAIAKQAIELGR